MYFTYISRVLLAILCLTYVFEKTLKIDILNNIKNKNIVVTIYIIFSIAVIYNIFNRDFYLPFLGPSVIPIKQIDIQDNRKTTVNLKNLPSNKRIIYWASNPSKNNFSDPLSAYKGYGNTGISKTDENGNVTIKIYCPSEYYIPKKFGMKRKLRNHIHYRIETDYEGLFGSVKTHYVIC
jgi:hypothetical protein